MLKKIIALMLSLLMVAGLVACTTTTTTEGGGESEYYVVESYISTIVEGNEAEEGSDEDSDGDTSKDSTSSKDKNSSKDKDSSKGSSSKDGTTSKDSNSKDGTTSKDSASKDGTASKDSNSKDGASSKDSASTGNKNETSSKTESKKDEPKKGRFDVGSVKEVKLLLWYTPEDWEQKIYDAFEKETGAKVKFVPTGTQSVQQKLTALIAANSAPDAAIFEGSDFPQFITKKLAQPLTNYIDKKQDTWLAYELMDACKYGGEYYGVTDHFWGGSSFVYFNKDIFNNSKTVKNTPLELYEQGKWNWDTFYELSKQLTVTDSKGNVTQWGSASSAVDHFIRSAGGSVITIKDGKVTNTINTKQLKDACAFQKKLYKENIYAKDQGSWTKGNIAMYIYPQYPVRTDNYESWKSIKFDWDWVPFPSYTEGQSYQPTGIQMGSVPRKAKNPDAGFALVNFRAYYQENMKTLTQSNKAWVERYKKAVTGKTQFSLEVGIIGGDIWTLYGELTSPETSLQSKIDSWSSVVDGKIKAYEQELADFNF